LNLFLSKINQAFCKVFRTTFGAYSNNTLKHILHLRLLSSKPYIYKDKVNNILIVCLFFRFDFFYFRLVYYSGRIVDLVLVIVDFLLMIIERETVSMCLNLNVVQRYVKFSALPYLQGDSGGSVGDLQGDLYINYVAQGNFFCIYSLLFCLCIIIFIVSMTIHVVLMIFFIFIKCVFLFCLQN